MRRAPYPAGATSERQSERGADRGDKVASAALNRGRVANGSWVEFASSYAGSEFGNASFRPAKVKLFDSHAFHGFEFAVKLL